MDIPERPFIKPWYRLAKDGERLLFEHGQAVLVLEGKATARLLPALLPLLDGERTLDEITEALGEPVEAATRSALQLLADRGVLTAGPTLEELPGPAQEAAHHLSSTSRTGASPGETRRALETASLALVGSGAVAGETNRLLRRSGAANLERVAWSFDDAPSSADLVIVTPAPSETPLLEVWNRRALEIQVPWLQVLPFDGRLATVGPLYLPGETCCYECYRHRRVANLEYGDEFFVLERSGIRSPAPPALVSALAGLAASLALRWLAHRDPLLPGAFYAFEPGALFRLSFHRVYRVPRCPACSGLEGLAAPLPWFKAAPV